MSNKLALSLTLLACGAGLARLPAAEPTKGVTVKVENGRIEFRAGDELITRYHAGPEVAKPYFWPLNAPGEVPVTRAYPMEKNKPGETTDHIHQKSAWFCHGDVIPEGIELKHKIRGVEGVDFWSEAPGHGRIVCTRVGTLSVIPDGWSVATTNEWRTADGVKILDEARTIRLHVSPTGRLFVLDIDLHASVCPVTFGDTKEGSMGVRVNDDFALNRKGSAGAVVSSDGKEAKAPARDNLPVWGQPADWHDYSGPVGGKTVGLAVFDDPANPHRAGWHTRAYGLMAANPFARAGSGFPSQKGKTDLVKLAKGDHLRLRYGILVHSGDAAGGKVAEHYQRFVKGR